VIDEASVGRWRERELTDAVRSTTIGVGFAAAVLATVAGFYDVQYAVAAAVVVIGWTQLVGL
jgi:hypothetical protein